MFISGFERLVALRYLRPRRQEGFVSIIATLSMLGIAIGVAALIIVMAVMNGFRQELLAQILGVNGHLTVFSDQPRIDSYDDLAQRIGAVDGVVMVTRSEEHTSELQSLMRLSYAVFCLKKKTQ